MAGHSKWANIKRKKEANDKVKAKTFAKLSRMITMAVQEGGGLTDTEFNVKLRLAVEKARQSNMPKENIQRAIEKGSSPDSANLKHVQYEAFGPAGVAFIITGSTDNPNRTAAEVRNILLKHDGKLGSQGSVSYLFEQAGYISFDTTKNAEDTVLEFSEAIGSTDIDQDGEVVSIYFPFEKLGEVKNVLGDLISLEGPDNTYRPLTTIKVDNEATAEKIVALIDTLEDVDDIQEVYINGIL